MSLLFAQFSAICGNLTVFGGHGGENSQFQKGNLCGFWLQHGAKAVKIAMLKDK